MKKTYDNQLVDSERRHLTRNHIDTRILGSHEEFYSAVKARYTGPNRKKESTIHQHLNLIMESHLHPVIPVDWLNLNPDQVLRYLDYVENVEKRSPNAVIHRWKAIKNVATMCGYHPEDWGYVPPHSPRPKVRIIPPPGQVHDLIHADYTSGYLGLFTQYLLTHQFIIGCRPSEIVIQTCSNVFPDDGYIIIVETKKYSQQRQVWVEPDVLSRQQRKSIKNWLDYVRPKYENQYSGDYLYIQENGRPWTVAYLRKIIVPMVKRQWSPFSLYTMRHWCAIARLIGTKVETGVFAKQEVKDHLGHEKESTTDEYIRFAESYYRQYPYDWIRAVLRPPTAGWEANGAAKSTMNAKNPLSSVSTNRGAVERAWRDSNPRPTA